MHYYWINISEIHLFCICVGLYQFPRRCSMRCLILQAADCFSTSEIVISNDSCNHFLRTWPVFISGSAVLAMLQNVIWSPYFQMSQRSVHNLLRVSVNEWAMQMYAQRSIFSVKLPIFYVFLLRYLRIVLISRLLLQTSSEIQQPSICWNSLDWRIFFQCTLKNNFTAFGVMNKCLRWPWCQKCYSWFKWQSGFHVSTNTKSMGVIIILG